MQVTRYHRSKSVLLMQRDLGNKVSERWKSDPPARVAVKHQSAKMASYIPAWAETIFNLWSHKCTELIKAVNAIRLCKLTSKKGGKLGTQDPLGSFSVSP